MAATVYAQRVAHTTLDSGWYGMELLSKASFAVALWLNLSNIAYVYSTLFYTHYFFKIASEEFHNA